MSAKIKHNKKRNTIFLYEALVRELTKATVEKEQIKSEAVLSIVREHFNHETILGREVKIYKNKIFSTHFLTILTFHYITH